MAVNYRLQAYNLEQQIKEDIKAIVLINDSHINIPFYYDEDDMDDDIQTLIDDEYDVRAEIGCNLNVETINHCGYINDIEVVAIEIHKDEVILIDKKSHIHYLNDLTRLYDLIAIYEKITE